MYRFRVKKKKKKQTRTLMLVPICCISTKLTIANIILMFSAGITRNSPDHATCPKCQLVNLNVVSIDYPTISSDRTE